MSGPVHTTLKIYNILGQMVVTLVDEPKVPGYHSATWDGKDSNGKDVASGIYFYRLSVGRDHIQGSHEAIDEIRGR
ncbi:MAG: FlgD immunoglobulin-like domain containing protein [bacterium]